MLQPLEIQHSACYYYFNILSFYFQKGGIYMVKVSAAILYESGSLLICQRKPGGACSLLWEFPGGKQEPGETPAGCMVRECREELSLQVEPLSVCRQILYRYPEREVFLTFYYAEITGGKIAKNVHEKLQWVPPQKLPLFSFCPADAELVRALAATPPAVFRRIYGTGTSA
jgi:8-oxo-dGTP diphosphatase